MSLKQWFVWLTLGLALCLPLNSSFAESRDPYKYFFNETWGDFHEELANAKQQGKKGILVFFEMDECPFCRWMKANVLDQSDVQAYFREQFLNFPLDIEGDIEITDFSGNARTQKDFATKEIRVRATPVIGFFDLDGKLITRFTGRTADTEEFMLLGKYVAEGHYKDGPFLKFKKQHKSNTQGG